MPLAWALRWGAGPKFSLLKEEAILPSGCRPLEIYLLEFLAGLFYHWEKTE